MAVEQAVEETAHRLLLTDVEGLVLEAPRAQLGGELGGLGQRLHTSAAADHDRA